MADVYLTQRDIDYISRVVATEVPASLKQSDPEEYGRMVNAVVDTMVNRVASDSYPDNITDVANQSRQFSKITGPARLNPYGSVQAAPKASQALQSMVAGRIADLAQGAESEINGALSYANPSFSDASNLASWINPMIEAGALQLGIGDMTHFHGLAPGQEAVTDVNVTAEGIPSTAIPVPYGPNDDPFANSLQAQAIDGFSGLANPVSAREQVAMSDIPAAQKEPGEWGVINGVGPVYTPTFNQWDDVASAAPVQAPMGSVQAQGFLGANPALAASTTAGMLNAAQPNISQADIDRAFFNVTGAGQMDPAFTEGLVSPGNPVVPTSAQSISYTQQPSTEFASVPAEKTSRIGTTQSLEDMARLNPLSGAINPATNTTSFMDQPANLGSMPDAYAAQRGPNTGLLSAEHQTQVANATRGMLNPSVQAPAAQPASEVATGGFLNNPAFAATNFNAAVNPSVPSLNVPSVSLNDQQISDTIKTAAIPGVAAAMMAQPSVTPAEQAIDNVVTGSTTPGLLSPTSITASSPTLTGGGSLTSGLNRGLLADQPINQVGFLSDLSPNIDINLSGNIVPAAPAEVAAPALETVAVKDQPTIAGPANDTIAPPAETETATTSSTPSRTVTKTAPATATQKSFADRMKAAVNPGTALGAAIGGGLLGVPGALAGGFLGNAVNQGGFLNDPMSINNIGSGYDAVTSVWGGSQPVGTQATASDGQRITQLPGGLIGVTNAQGVTTGFDSTGKGYAVFGGVGDDQTADTEGRTSGGGFLSGFFG